MCLSPKLENWAKLGCWEVGDFCISRQEAGCILTLSTVFMKGARETFKKRTEGTGVHFHPGEDKRGWTACASD